MPFNDTPRVVYQRNPLVEVICQIRFPAILRIDAEPPADFQDEIRVRYPLFQQDQEAPLTVEVPAELRQLLGTLPDAIPHAEKRVRYLFRSEDEVWTVALASEFLGLTTNSYESWDGFRERLDEVFRALMAIYRPAVFTRIGLRYRNLIRRSDLELSDCAWDDLIEPHIAGPLATDPIAGRKVAESKGVLALQADAESVAVTLRHGLVQASGPNEGETAYLIDNDFYTEERTNADGILNFLNAANTDAGGLFRWCITTKLHQALQPKDA